MAWPVCSDVRLNATPNPVINSLGPPSVSSLINPSTEAARTNCKTKIKGFRVNKDLLMRFVSRHQTGAIFVAISPAVESNFSKFNGNQDERWCLEVHAVFT